MSLVVYLGWYPHPVVILSLTQTRKLWSLLILQARKAGQEFLLTKGDGRDGMKRKSSLDVCITPKCALVSRLNCTSE